MAKASRAAVAQRCAEAGVVFQPLIFESLGGVSSEADDVIKSINRAVAENSDSRLSEIATLFWWGLAIDLQRAQHRAFAKRVRGLGFGLGDDGDGGGLAFLGCPPPPSGGEHIRLVPLWVADHSYMPCPPGVGG